MGQFVEIEENKVDEMAAGYVGGVNILGEKYTQTFQLVDQMKNQVEVYLGELNNALSLVALPADFDDILGDVVIDDIGGIENAIPVDKPVKPTLPGFTAISFPLLPALKVAPNIDLSFDKPVKPGDVNPTIDYILPTYSSEMWYSLFAKVQDGIDNGGTGLAPEAEASIHARNAERQREANEAAYINASKAIATRAVPYPQLALRSVEQRMGAEIIRQARASSDEIAVSQATLAQQNTQFMIDKGIGMEQILRSFYDVQERLSLEAKKAVAQFVLDNYAEKNKAYIAQWQGVSAELQAKVDIVNAIVAENASVISGFKAQTDGAIAQTEMISKERESLVGAYEVDGKVYGDTVDAQSKWYAVLSENQKTQLAAVELKLRRAIAQVTATIDSTVSVNSLREKILEAMSGIVAQVLASALNAVNASIGHSTSASEGRTENWSHGESLGESHNYEHDPDA